VIDENKKLGIIMKYPTLNSIDPTIDLKKENTKQLFDIIGKTIYQVYEGEKVYKASDYTKEELDKFVESLDNKTFSKIQKFYETMPRLLHIIEVENPETKVKSKVTLSGLTDFFG
jgi:predicted nucleotide-binding protein (sugar kinase/HSP70/actin superfamily)